MMYDDVSWHAGKGFPGDLPPTAAATHVGMFVAWALAAGLGNEARFVDVPSALESLKGRQITPGAFFLQTCEGQLTDLELSAAGNAFAQHYFDLEDGQYLVDYDGTLGVGLSSHYHVPDTWQTFERLRPVLDARLAAWRAAAAPA